MKSEALSGEVKCRLCGRGQRTMALDNSDKIAFLALSVSIVALGLSLFDFLNSRAANRASVAPIMITSFIFNQEGVGWVMPNSGLGPGRVDWLEVQVDRQPVHTWEQMILKLNIPGRFSYRFAVPTGQAYASGKEVKLFWVEPRQEQAEEFLRDNVERVFMRLCFCSLQNECWPQETGVAAKPVDSCRAINAKPLHMHGSGRGGI